MVARPKRIKYAVYYIHPPLRSLDTLEHEIIQKFTPQLIIGGLTKKRATEIRNRLSLTFNSVNYHVIGQK